MKNGSELYDGFYIEDWLVKPDLGYMAKGEQKVHLEPKIMEVLVLLAANQGDVVRKGKFFETVWEDTNVSGHVLARAISEIRKVFTQGSGKSKVIQTIPKIGYRLMATVSMDGRFEAAQDISNHSFELGFAPAPSTFANPKGQFNRSNILFFLFGIISVLFFAVFIALVLSGKHSTEVHFGMLK